MDENSSKTLDPMSDKTLDAVSGGGNSVQNIDLQRCQTITHSSNKTRLIQSGKCPFCNSTVEKADYYPPMGELYLCSGTCGPIWVI